MDSYYYSTKTILELAFGCFFYRRRYYTYVATVFYPSRRANPPSSNPMLIYRDLYDSWKYNDKYSKYILALRMNMRKGVLAQQQNGLIDVAVSNRLTDLCDRAPVSLFQPLVLRVNAGKIAKNRLNAGGSSWVGSEEFLIADLADSEFELLFTEECVDGELAHQVVQCCLQHNYLDTYEALDLLEGQV